MSWDNGTIKKIEAIGISLGLTGILDPQTHHLRTPMNAALPCQLSLCFSWRNIDAYQGPLADTAVYRSTPSWISTVFSLNCPNLVSRLVCGSVRPVSCWSRYRKGGTSSLFLSLSPFLPPLRDMAFLAMYNLL